MDTREPLSESRRYYEPRKQEAAKQWIRDHQEAAMLAAFAIGVFIGTWMRS